MLVLSLEYDQSSKNLVCLFPNGKKKTISEMQEIRESKAVENILLSLESAIEVSYGSNHVKKRLEMLLDNIQVLVLGDVNVEVILTVYNRAIEHFPKSLCLGRIEY